MWRLERVPAAVLVDAALLRRCRELRLLMIGQGISLAGSMVTLVALPIQYRLAPAAGRHRPGRHQRER